MSEIKFGDSPTDHKWKPVTNLSLECKNCGYVATILDQQLVDDPETLRLYKELFGVKVLDKAKAYKQCPSEIVRI